MFLIGLFVRFTAVDCVKGGCEVNTHGQIEDLFSLGQFSLIYCVILTVGLTIFLQEKSVIGNIKIVFRMLLGASVGYFFPLLVMLGTRLLDAKFIYPYITFSALFGAILFILNRPPFYIKLVVIILLNFVILPGGQIVNADVYRYAFDGKVDYSNSIGFYAVLY